ncbi:glycoside hydrolase family 35 protein [Luteipulveratus mongoliensis]|uniref:Beta-galactosidase n=1 Tax=Luteipulveratus mongoliensis TaxID=571913 RepID=A0A0K1JF10_9MICO|nr:beta-galactosidase family protein [Luteipulveratus mongoliensis]AKU15289.1 beta-galactosidase [Luteipulveratus mongoliensis]
MPQIISGAFHYARVHPDQWRPRLELCRAMGLDTIETYVPWNLHEPQPGDFRFDGFADIEAFLEQVATAGLQAIVRPGPYICAEWDNGGLPAWLTGTPDIHIRTADSTYLEAVDRWFDELIPRIAARQVTRGGNVTMLQIENEYGSYGSDLAYLTHLRDGLRARGIDVPLFTSDGPGDHMLTGGTIDGAAATVNFGSKPTEAFDTLRRHRPRDPLFCMEFWNGWFDHWGEKHHVRAASDVAATLDEMLSMGASVNFYMVHGGTSFGVTAGANHDGSYLPTVTSYDYDAPIDEAGRPTEKYWAYREVIGRHREIPAPPEPAEPAVLPQTTVALDSAVSLRAAWDTIATGGHRSPHPPTYEELGISHGLVRYRAHLRGPRQAYPLTLPGVADRAHVYAGGELLGIVNRDDDAAFELEVPAEGLDLEVLVESMGRVNYGVHTGERKGLVEGVLHGGQYVHGWDVSALELPDLPAVDWSVGGAGGPVRTGPALLRGTFDCVSPADGFLALDGWGKGYVWINGFCLGRYWDKGPQRTLYVPAPVVRDGANEVVVLELDRLEQSTVTFEASADLGRADA